jgi:hypothetical protein
MVAGPSGVTPFTAITASVLCQSRQLRVAHIPLWMHPLIVLEESYLLYHAPSHVPLTLLIYLQLPSMTFAPGLSC